ncbi:MAG TPA: universal stress protein, partial [Blastocatellia bacterium]|nr:universal stress protein [Blastocatellia bacterium]
RQLAGRLRAAATVVGVAENPDAAEALRVAIKNRQEAAGLSHAELHVRFGNPAEQIAGEQAESLYEMLVLTPRPRSKAPRLPVRDSKAKTRKLGETLAAVLEHADIPVLVAKGERASLDRMLICTAAGEPGKSDVIIGGRLARRLGAAVTLFYVTRGSEEMNAVTRSHLERAAATLRSLDVNSEVRIQPAATPADGILTEAKTGDYDLIVIGSHGPRLRRRFGLNDVTLEVLDGADRPVLVVPTDKV